MFEDFSLLTCSYNTPEILELCLKSFVFHHGRGPHNIIIVENSTDIDTQNILDLNNITYLKNPGGNHSSSVDLAFQLVKTRYALLIDTDVIFNRSIDATLYFFKRYDLTLLGEVQEDRGEFLLYPRVAPYFCFINMENIHASGIRFHDEERIKSTRSEGFFKNIPINYERGNHKFYDVGATFYEDVQKNNFRIANLDEIRNLVFHAESLSWALNCDIEVFAGMGKQRQSDFYRMATQYKNVDIKNCFNGFCVDAGLPYCN